MSHIPNVPNDGFHGHGLREAQARWSRLATADFSRITSEAESVDVAMWERNRRS
jgi:hypothetical protein